MARDRGQLTSASKDQSCDWGGFRTLEESNWSGFRTLEERCVLWKVSFAFVITKSQWIKTIKAYFFSKQSPKNLVKTLWGRRVFPCYYPRAHLGSAPSLDLESLWLIFYPRIRDGKIAMPGSGMQQHCLPPLARSQWCGHMCLWGRMRGCSAVLLTFCEGWASVNTLQTLPQWINFTVQDILQWAKMHLFLIEKNLLIFVSEDYNTS